jgi:hypothetical protein
MAGWIRTCQIGTVDRETLLNGPLRAIHCTKRLWGNWSSEVIIHPIFRQNFGAIHGLKRAVC